MSPSWSSPRRAPCPLSWWTRSSRPTASSPAGPSPSDATRRAPPRSLALSLARRVARLHHRPQAGPAELLLEVPVGRVGGYPLLADEPEALRADGAGGRRRRIGAGGEALAEALTAGGVRGGGVGGWGGGGGGPSSWLGGRLEVGGV